MGGHGMADGRNAPGSSRRRKLGAATVTTAVALLVAACGGSNGSKTASATSTTSTSAASTASTDAVTAPTASTEVGTSATTTAIATQTTSSTAKKSTSATTVKKSTTQATVATVVKGGISNVTAAPTTVPGVNIKPGGTLVMLKNTDMASFDPLALINAASTDGPNASMVFDHLIYNDGKTGQPVPQTAESLTSTDGLTWTLKLRPNIKFTDGTPYDAAAVKFNWDRLADPKNAAAKQVQASTIASTSVVDAQTLSITLKSKNSVFPQTVIFITYIGSPTAIQAEGAGFASAPVGAGPFVLKSWTRDSQMVMTRNPNYWNSPRPYLDQVVTKIIADASQRSNTFKTTSGGVLNVVTTPADVDAALSSGGVDNHIVLNGGSEIMFNIRKAPFNDLRARQAIAAALDRADLVKVVDLGKVVPMNSVFGQDSPFYDPAILQTPFDATKAQQLFDQLAADNGGPLTFTISTFNVGPTALIAQYIQGALSKYKNVKVNVDAVAVQTQLTRLATADFTIGVTATPFTDPDPTWTSLFTCAGQALNTGFCNAQFDADVADQRATLDPNRRIADFKDAQKVFYAQIPALFIEYRVLWNITTPVVQDVQMINDGMTLYDRIWINS
jgi:peptide/nickel transport system substrate-binding protein